MNGGTIAEEEISMIYNHAGFDDETKLNPALLLKLCQTNPLFSCELFPNEVVEVVEVVET